MASFFSAYDACKSIDNFSRMSSKKLMFTLFLGGNSSSNYLDDGTIHDCLRRKKKTNSHEYSGIIKVDVQLRGNELDPLNGTIEDSKTEDDHL